MHYTKIIILHFQGVSWSVAVFLKLVSSSCQQRENSFKKLTMQTTKRFIYKTGSLLRLIIKWIKPIGFTLVWKLLSICIVSIISLSSAVNDTRVIVGVSVPKRCLCLSNKEAIGQSTKIRYLYGKIGWESICWNYRSSRWCLHTVHCAHVAVET